MRKWIVTFTFIVSGFFVFSCMEQDPVAPESGNLKENISLSKQAASDAKLVSNGSYILISSTNKLPAGLEQSVAKINGRLTNSISEIGVAVVESAEPDFISKASKIKGVRSVVNDYTVQWLDPDMRREALDEDFGNPPTSGDDDFFFDLQWGHDAVDAPEAWAAGARGAGVRVAVLDDGIDSDHPDIAPNLNTALSASFVPGEPFEYLNNFPGDPFSHGTHVSGTILAADNGYGTIGIAPEAELVMVKVLSSFTGSGAFSWVINGIIYAANIDADVINMSLSGSFPQNLGREAAELKVAINRATTYAYQKGTTVIAAASNDALDRDHDKSLLILPADGPNVIQISSTAPIGWAVDPTTDLDVFASSYSNYGQSAIDFAAPGGNFVYPGNESCTVAGITRPCWVFDFVFSTGSSGSWYWSVGTSMAAPHAAGVAALIIGQNGGSMHPAQVESVMRRSADDLGKPGNDDFYGQGRVNAYKAVTM
ncbi:MAG: S8 family serine peptidase [Calditrichaceae bacterium]